MDGVIRDPLGAEKGDFGDKVISYFKTAWDKLVDFFETIFMPMLLDVARDTLPALLAVGAIVVKEIAASGIEGDRDRRHAAEDRFKEALKDAGITATDSAINYILEYTIRKLKRQGEL